jgi:hypothetical protein
MVLTYQNTQRRYPEDQNVYMIRVWFVQRYFVTLNLCETQYGKAAG